MLPGEMGRVAGAGPLGPLLPLRPRRQQTSDGGGDLVRFGGIHRQAGFGRIDYFSAGVERAHQTRTSDSHSLQVHEAEAYAGAGERETAAALDEALLLEFGDVAVE